MLIHPANADAVRLFVMLKTQWRFAGLDGAPMGLDYQAIEPTARLAGIETTPKLFNKLRVMEYAALSEIAESHR
ncbi:DUF1799 domain-containing protein [Magnetovibrio sp.]|uniref:DUF1799 domain-containing protein n=1 Tax=Magnetovibrio sp. TaxID=2024836 RepID=UPI002F9321AE